MKAVVFITLIISVLGLDFAFSQSQDNLNQACEDARAKKLEPAKRQKISECKADKKNDPKWCEDFWADYGHGGKTGPKVRQRMVDDLPECVKADKARRDVN